MTTPKPRLFPLPAAPIDRATRSMWRHEVVALIAAALNSYYLTMPPYEPPPVYNNPRA